MGHGSAAIAMAGRSVRLLLLYFPLALLLAGCGTVGISLASTLAGMLTADAITHDSRTAAEADTEAHDLAVPGMDGSPIDYPIAFVYRELIRAAESDGLKVADTDEVTYTLVISYPLSLAQNNWGGKFTVNCVVEGSGTRVLFKGNSHDATPTA